jgi:hypothetical protein
MTAAPVLPWPGSRTLLGWWRELTARQPRRFGFSHLPLHRVETLVRLANPHRLEPLQTALLRWLAASPRAECGFDPGHDGLQIERSVLVRILGELANLGLIERQAGIWQVTPRGQSALPDCRFTTAAQERRVFYFLDNESFQRPPHFLALSPLSLPLPAVTESWPFDPAVVEACVRQSPEWKKRHHFPTEVEAIECLDAEAPSWRGVLVDRLEMLPAAWIEAARPGEASRLEGFVVKLDGWVLEGKTPVFALTEGWQGALPDIAEEPSAEAWRQAWQAWCQPRGLPVADVEACRLEPAGPRLRVQAPERLIERLRQARSDALKHEAWLLAGRGRTRVAAQIDLVS